MSGVSARFLGIFGFLLLDDLFLGVVYFSGEGCMVVSESNRIAARNVHSSAIATITSSK